MSENAKILLIDDDRMICATLTRILEEEGCDVTSVGTLQAGIQKAREQQFDLVFLDVRLPDGNGLEALPMIRTGPSKPEVIIITGYAEADGAELAMKNNAWDYIKKPTSIDAILLVTRRAMEYRREKEKATSPVSLNREGIIGNSPKLLACLDMVARSANSMANIFITGETGTGKELFARAIHANSSRSENNFVVVDCGSLPDTLTESILFGHAKGAFTGAATAREGLIKHADGGTLFLDEVGELPLETQKIFLRVLQEKRFHRVGETREITSHFRLVSASNRDLDEWVRTGRFREDLLFRLRSISIELPPLRERVSDIEDLVIHHVRFLTETHGVGMKGFSPEFFEAIGTYPWPGNVRELFSALEWTVTRALHEPTLYPMHLPEYVRVQIARSSFENDTVAMDTNSDALSVDLTHAKWQTYRKTLISRGETRYLKNLMKRTGGDVKEAARQSGLSVPRIYELWRKYGLSKP